MHNMLAEAIVRIAELADFKTDEVMVIDMLTRPDTKNFRPGMPMDTLRLSLSHSPDGDVMKLHVSLVKIKSNGTELSRQEKVVLWSEARHFLRGLFTTQKLFDFKQHAPFYRILTDEGRKQTV